MDSEETNGNVKEHAAQERVNALFAVLIGQILKASTETGVLSVAQAFSLLDGLATEINGTKDSAEVGRKAMVYLEHMRNAVRSKGS
jgi:hypothetical protein